MAALLTSVQKSSMCAAQDGASTLSLLVSSYLFLCTMIHKSQLQWNCPGGGQTYNDWYHFFLLFILRSNSYLRFTYVCFFFLLRSNTYLRFTSVWFLFYCEATSICASLLCVFSFVLLRISHYLLVTFVCFLFLLLQKNCRPIALTVPVPDIKLQIVFFMKIYLICAPRAPHQTQFTLFPALIFSQLFDAF